MHSVSAGLQFGEFERGFLAVFSARLAVLSLVFLIWTIRHRAAPPPKGVPSAASASYPLPAVLATATQSPLLV